MDRTTEQRLDDLEHDNNLLRAQIADVLSAFSILRKAYEDATEQQTKLVKRVNEFLSRWTVA